MPRLRHRLTYANVVSTLCLCLLVGGGVAYATHESIRSSDIVDGEIKRVDIAASTGKLFAGHKRLAGDTSQDTRAVLEVPNIATLRMSCFDNSPGGDVDDSMSFSIKNTSGETQYVAGLRNGELQEVTPNDTAGPLFKPHWAGAVFQVGSPGPKAQLATFIVSAEALPFTDSCYAQAHAISHIR